MKGTIDTPGFGDINSPGYGIIDGVPILGDIPFPVIGDPYTAKKHNRRSLYRKHAL